MNVIPSMIHQMVYIDDVLLNKLNVTDDVTNLIGDWVNGIYNNDDDTTNNDSKDGDDDDEGGVEDLVLGIFLGLGAMLILCVIIGTVLVKGCGYELFHKRDGIRYSAF